MGSQAEIVPVSDRIRVRHSGVGQRIAGIFFDGLLKIFQTFLHAFVGSLVPIVASLQIKPISLRILGIALGDCPLFFPVQLNAQVRRDGFGNVFLDALDVRQLLGILFAPDLRLAVHIHQLRTHQKGVAAPRHSSGHNCANVELLPDLFRRAVLSLVTEHRTARHHSQLRHMREAVDNAFGYAVAQVLRVRISASICKRQYRD